MTESFLALARKYRPKKLSELIGQDIFVSTIQNALKNKRLAHAYLFSGVRGVGKTTTARILAHLFNGEEEVKGTTGSKKSKIPKFKKKKKKKSKIPKFKKKSN